MIAFLDHKKGACTDWLKDNPYFQVQSLWVFRQRIGESAFEWAARLFSSCKIPAIFYFIEDFLEDQSPQSPNEDFIRACDGYLQTSSNEEPLLIDDVFSG